MFRILPILFLSFFTIIHTSCDNTQTVKDQNGNILESFHLNDDGEKEGLFERFDSNHNLIETSNYVNGKLDGKRTFFYPSGEIELIEHYKADVMEGVCNTFHKNGQLKLTSTYENGEMNCIIKKYNENGALLEEVTIKSNEENGPFKEYYENGNVKWEGNYKNGDNEFGLLKHYKESGELIKKMMCDEHGICRTIWSIEKGDIKLEPLNLKINE